MGTRSKKRRREEDSSTIDTYFWERIGDGSQMQLRDEIVRKNELWSILEWFYAIQMIDSLPWYRRLWRWIRRKPPVVGAAAILRREALERRDNLIAQVDRMAEIKKEIEAKIEDDDNVIHLGDR